MNNKVVVQQLGGLNELAKSLRKRQPPLLFNADCFNDAKIIGQRHTNVSDCNV